MNARTGLRFVVGIMVATGAPVAVLADPVHPECVGPGTNVGGPISTDTTWTCANSPYVVTSSVIVRNGATLTIEPCVCVRFKANMGLTVGHTTGGGTLVARGTADSPIIFTTNDPYEVSPPDPARANPGDWVRIYFTDQARDAQFDEFGEYVSGSVLEHIIVEYSGNGGPAVTAANCSPYLAYCEVHDNASNGVWVDASNAGAVKIDSCRVHDHANGRGIGVRSGGLPVRIEYCEIARCSVNSYGGGIYVDGDNLDGGRNHVVSHNVIEECLAKTDQDNYGGGIFIDARTTIEGNIVTGCKARGAGGIALWDDSDGSRLSGNEVTKNTATHTIWWNNGWSNISGGGICLWRSGSCTLERNIVTGNKTTDTTGYPWHGTGGGIGLAESAGCVLDHNVVSGNTTAAVEGRGGGVYLLDSGSSLLKSNTVSGNRTSGQSAQGGGIYMYNCGSSLLRFNIVSGNRTSGQNAHGGGVYMANSSTGTGSRDRGLWENTISSNMTIGTDAVGGGITVDNGCANSHLESNTITGNTSNDNGGGVYFYNSGQWMLKTNVITDNTAAGEGGGIYMYNSGCPANDPRCKMTDTVIAHNHTSNGDTGGIYVYNSPRISFAGDPLTCTYNCICGNDGHCIYNDTPYDPTGSGDIDARYVKWCTEDPQDIQDCIYDYFDDARLGEVYWDPFVRSTSCEDYEWRAWRDLRDAAEPESCYWPGVPRLVSIQIRPPNGAGSVLLEDKPPTDWTVSDISNGGVWDPSTQKVKWGPFLAPNFPAEVHYTVTPPAETEGQFCFAGKISIDGQDGGVCGDKCIDECYCLYIPADQPQPFCDPDGNGSPDCGDCNSCVPASCEDHQVHSCEVSGYACAWKKDCNDDLSGMTRAAYIWKNGECYCWDETDQNWFPSPCPAPDSGCCSDLPQPSVLGLVGGAASRELRSQEAERNLPDCYAPGVEFEVTITITPDGASAVALEDQPPAGWAVGAISEGCELSPIHGKVKCGPYFDDAFPTEVRYTVTPAQDACGRVCFAGTVSFDGINQPVGGDQCINHCPGSSAPPNCAIDARQPSSPSFVDPVHPELGCRNPAGWDTIQMTVTWDPAGVVPEDFTVTVVPDGTPPGICDVTVAGQTVTVRLCSIIPTGKWTCVEHTACHELVCIGDLPADVNADRTSSPVDILAIIDCLNGAVVPPCEKWQCDADRSGQCNPADILRVIDLLNGADCFDPWLGRTLPPCPSAP